MPIWMASLGWSRVDAPEAREQHQPLLPTSRSDALPSPIPAEAVTKIALRLKFQIEQVIPFELNPELVTQPHNEILTSAVLKTARNAGGEEHKACVVYGLLTVRKWFRVQARRELWDADLHLLRADACEILAKRIIEDIEEEEGGLDYLFDKVLLTRYSHVVNGKDTTPVNVIEKAVDTDALRVIGASGYQKTIMYLWRGWWVQDDDAPVRFVPYANRSNVSYWSHLDPDRMRVPRYQNAMHVIISTIYLGLFTAAINTVNPSGDLDIVEGFLYLFTLGFLTDEIVRSFKVGWYYYWQFWNLFNLTLYSLLLISFILRMIALSNSPDSPDRATLNEKSYYFLACTAPFFWGRLLLFLDNVRFFGTMVIVVSRMMKESLIFFALLIVIMIGFMQAFLGLDQVDEQMTAVEFISKAMLNAVMTSPDFDGFDNYAPPFGLVLYYVYTFVVMVVLLNVLVALYNSAYESITDNATDHYLALVARKTMQFVRAPDENVFIPPFNLIEIFLLVLPFEWWMDRYTYQRINDWVMGFLYSPFLLVSAALETRQAHAIKHNRRMNEADEDTVEEWEQLVHICDFEHDGWAKQVEESRPNLDNPRELVEVMKLRQEVGELKELLEKVLSKQQD